jgi:GR25 family glycosyltransferase involved in LPS biosynthesis
MTSHIAAYQRALQDGTSHLVVFEDDCATVPGFSLEKVKAYLQGVKRFATNFGIKGFSDMVLLGTCGCYRWKDLTAGLKATDHFNGSHAYIIGRSMMSLMIHAYSQFLAQKKTAPIDGLLPRLLQEERRHVFCPEDDTSFFRQNREIPSYVISDGIQLRTD